ncbi:MAG TPA: hypothetical protein DC058_00020, partial [Planctomycetaceae bacterium]|nr:hypothetical protein [Planctomycetaceae bacterium]
DGSELRNCCGGRLDWCGGVVSGIPQLIEKTEVLGTGGVGIRATGHSEESPWQETERGGFAGSVADRKSVYSSGTG